MSVKTTNKKKLKTEIYHVIRNDLILKRMLAKSLNIEVESVYKLAVRESTKFSLPFVLDIITKHTGKSKIEILEE